MPCGESEHLDPSLTDHHCRVHISVGLVPASLAVEDRLALAILPRHMPAGGACLTGERRWYFNHPHARRLGLLLDPTPYLAQPEARICRLSTAFWRTFLTGRSRALLALCVICRIWSASKAMTS